MRSAVVYFSLFFLLRISGKRQLGQLSPFDLMLLLIVSEAVQNSIVGSDNSLIGGLIAVTTLILVNYVVGLMTFRHRRFEDMMEGRPQVLMHEGKMFEDIMQNAKLTHQELKSALGHLGYFELKDVKLAILENNGTISVQSYNKSNNRTR